MIVLYLLAAAEAVAAVIVLARLTRGKDRPEPLHPGHTARPGSISIVIPARNEADRIRPLLTALTQTTSTEREEIVIDDLERIMAVNVKGMFNCARHAVPTLRTACNNCLTVFMWSSVA